MVEEEPEVNLLTAILGQAYLDYYSPSSDMKAHGQVALRDWFLSQSMEPFTYRWIKQRLELSPRLCRMVEDDLIMNRKRVVDKWTAWKRLTE